MPDLLIETANFLPTADVQVAEWLRQQLTRRGYSCDPPAEKDGFWGFWVLKQTAPIWVLVAPVSDEGPTYEWGISVDAKLSSFNPANWFKKTEAQSLAVKIMSAVIEACEQDAGIVVVETAGTD
jgi:hypothetical protein